MTNIEIFREVRVYNICLSNIILMKITNDIRFLSTDLLLRNPCCSTHNFGRTCLRIFRYIIFLNFFAGIERMGMGLYILTSILPDVCVQVTLLNFQIYRR